MSVARIPPDFTVAAQNSNDVSLLYSVPPGANLFVVNISINNFDGSVVTMDPLADNNVTYGAFTLSLLTKSFLFSATNYTAIYYLVTPPIGIPNNISIVADPMYTGGTLNIVVIVQQFSDANTADPFESTNSGFLSPTGSPLQVSLPAPTPPTYTTDQIVVDIITIDASNSAGVVSPLDPTIYFNSNGISSDIALFLYYRDLATANMTYEYSVISVPGVTYASYVINGLTACVASDTLILMADGNEKQIKDIQRGDLVFGDVKLNIINKVAQVNKTILGKNHKLSIVKLEKGALTLSKASPIYPTKDLIMTDPHPIIWDGIRKPARCFEKLNGVTWYKKIIAGEILPINNEGYYELYDLVFDHDGNYIANGVQVQAHSPWCHIGSLPKELYYNPENYVDLRSWHCLAHSLPWDDNVINPYKQQVNPARGNSKLE